MRGVEQIPWLYDAGLRVSEWLGLARWRAWVAGGGGPRTLDLGTGTGRNLPLLPAGSRAVAVDPFLPNLARARRRAGATPLVAAHAEALPFRDGAFDTVLSGLVLCSVRDPAAALAEVRRVLRPGGELRALEHVRHHRRALARLQDAIQPLWTAFTGGCHPNRETERAIRDAGFQVTARLARGNLRALRARRP